MSGQGLFTTISNSNKSQLLTQSFFSLFCLLLVFPQMRWARKYSKQINSSTCRGVHVQTLPHKVVTCCLKYDFKWTTLNSVQLGFPHSTSLLRQIRIQPFSHVAKAWRKCKTLKYHCRNGQR